MDASPETWKGLLGRKVSVRYKLRDDPRHQFSEVVGVVMGIQDSERGELITILNRQAEQVVVASKDVVARKMFPTS